MTERELYRTKHWDYRLMTPTGATFSCALAYFRALRAYKHSIGESPYEAVVASQRVNLTEPHLWKHWQTMTKLRRLCDSYGMAYDRFWELAFEAHTELKMPTRLIHVGKRRQPILLIPMECFLNVGLLKWVIKRKVERIDAFVQYAKHPFLQPGAYVGHPLQIAYYDSILKQLARNPKNCTPERIAQLIDDGKIARAYLERRAS